MLQYLEGKLPPQSAQKVQAIIDNCEECATLFEEVKFFFDDTSTFLYEISHKEEIESSKRRFQRLVASENGANRHIATPADIGRQENNFDEDICFCCGS